MEGPKQDYMEIKHICTLGILGVCGFQGYSQPRPNIVFILADDLGYSDLGCTGSDFYQTPNIDGLAAQGTCFTSAYAPAANSAPSRASILTGLYAPRHGIYTVSPSARGRREDRRLIPVETKDVLDASFVTVAEALHAAGYTCAHIGKWHLGEDASGRGPCSQGFDVNVGGGHQGAPYTYYYPYRNRSGESLPGLEEGSPGEYLTDRLTDEALDFIRHAKGPFFLYLPYYAVHTPLEAPRELLDKYRGLPRGEHHGNASYAAMIENLDTNVGRLLGVLDSLALSDRTMVVFCSDNGGSEPITDNYPLRGGKGTPYEGGIRVPLIVRWPGVCEGGTEVRTPVCGIDLLPTFVHAAQGRCPEKMDGVDLRDSAKLRERDLYWFFPAYLEAYPGDENAVWRATPYAIIRSGDYKLIRFFEDDHCELYNLTRDPSERDDLSGREPRITRRLRTRLDAWITATRAPVPKEKNPYYRERDTRPSGL